MKTIEYRTKDRSEWGAGPWSNEPDKVQWQDEATGLPCLMVRNHSGAWCGYVGVAEGHPLYGQGYSTRVPRPASFDARQYDESRTPIIAMVCESAKDDGLVSLELAIDVHGGLTFADFCRSHTREDWERWCKRMEESRAEAAEYPVGDAARRLREWAHEMTDFDAWKAKCQATGICHLPDDGEPDRVWWLGFDCSHAGDMSPAYQASYRFSGGDDAYRDVEYVRREVAGLAKQISEWK